MTSLSPGALSFACYRGCLRRLITTHRHPCEGQTTIAQDVGIRLVQGVHDLRLDENLAPTKEAINKFAATSSESVWKAVSAVKADLAKRQAEYREKQKQREAAMAVTPVAIPSTPVAGPTSSSTPVTPQSQIATSGPCSLHCSHVAHPLKHSQSWPAPRQHPPPHPPSPPPSDPSSASNPVQTPSSSRVSSTFHPIRPHRRPLPSVPLPSSLPLSHHHLNHPSLPLHHLERVSASAAAAAAQERALALFGDERAQVASSLRQ